MQEKKEVHFCGKIAQKAIIEKDSKVLLIRDPRMAEAIWEIPGGRMNEGEEPRAAIRREIYEELGVWCAIHEVVHMEQFFQMSENKNAFVIVYRATVEEGEADFTFEVGEVCEHRWVHASDLQTVTLFPEYRRALEHFFAKQL